MSCDCDTVYAYFNNDHVLTITGLLDASSNPLNSATVTYQFVDSDGDNVAGATGSLTPTGSGGNYSADIDKTIIDFLTDGQEYSLRVTGSQGGTDFEFNLLVVIPKRRGDS